jgi:hypothetical protein
MLVAERRISNPKYQPWRKMKLFHIISNLLTVSN